MLPSLIFFTIGVFCISFLPCLPPLWLPIVFAAISLFFARFRYGCMITALLAGACWGVFSGQQLVRHQLPLGFELNVLQVIGTVVELPDINQRRSRFKLVVEQCEDPKSGHPLPLKKLLLSWYGCPADIQPGQRWQLTVKLRRPRGFANPGGFDYRQWLLQQGISATGSVRTGAVNRLLGQRNNWPGSQRYDLRVRLQQLDLPARQKAVLRALLVADGSALSALDWSLLNRTGTTHLLVISGLHIGLFALFCYGVGWCLGRLLNLLVAQLPANLTAAGCSLFGAFFYAGLAGFGLPSTRALVMVITVLLIRCLRTRISPAGGLVIALAAVALIDPLAVHSAGFWLSFGAVAALLWAFAPGVGKGSWWQRLWRPQWVIFVALLVLLLGIFGQVPALSPLINSAAIPWVSLLVVPLCLLGVVASAVSTVAAEFCWQVAGWQLQELWRLLQLAGQWDGLMIRLQMPVSPALLLALLCGVLLLLMPRGLPCRWLSIAPFLLVFFAAPQRSPLSLSVLDVGQGLAVVVSTANHTLVYDTGAQFSARFDAGSGVVAPFLRLRGVTAVDRLVVSHGDNDHAGGVKGLLRIVPVVDIWSGEPLPDQSAVTPCRKGMSWVWDDVRFEVLSPGLSGPESVQADKGNNRSCVLLVSFAGQRILLPGDIEALQEEKLLVGGVPAANILVAPHHGSKTSSTEAFVRQVAPQHVIYSAGYRHHFGHPHRDVVERYRRLGSRQWHTAHSGALLMEWRDGRWRIREYRRQRKFFWQQ